MTKFYKQLGWYGDSTLEGDWCVLIPDAYIIVNDIVIDLPNGENVLFLVCTRFQGRVILAGQGGHSGICWLWDNGWINLGITFGVSPCAFSSQALYFVCGDNQYRVCNLEGRNISPIVNRQIGSQGIRYIDFNQSVDGIVTGDQTYGPSPYDLSQWSLKEDLVIGQSYTDGAIVKYNGISYKVEPGDTEFIRLKKLGDNLTIVIVKPAERRALFMWLTVEELKQFPVVSDSPSVPPIEVPPIPTDPTVPPSIPIPPNPIPTPIPVFGRIREY